MDSCSMPHFPNATPCEPEREMFAGRGYQQENRCPTDQLSSTPLVGLEAAESGSAGMSENTGC